jgi:hypothetical protein
MNELLEYYLKELLEALVVLVIYKVISKSDVKYQFLFQSAALIAVITTIFERYNKDYAKNLKSGVLASLGSIIIKMSVV